MIVEEPILPSSNDEIDLRDVLFVLQRRWRWVVGGGFLGLLLALGAFFYASRQVSQVTRRLIVDLAQGPCITKQRQIQTFAAPHVVCTGEIDTMRLRLEEIAKTLG